VSQGNDSRHEQPTSMSDQIDTVCDDFESCWQRGETPQLEDSLDPIPTQWRANVFCELVEIELTYLQNRGQTPEPDAYRARFPQFAELIDRLFRKCIRRQKLGGYELHDVIGRGGMGVVYKARHEMLNQEVALKVLPERCLNDHLAVERFKREMKLIGGLDSQHIVRAYNAGEESGQLYLAMEFVEGITLQQLVKQMGPLPVGAACELIRQAAVGLEHANRKGLVHRDIKPANLMLSNKCVVKILDLGLGRFLPDFDATRPTGDVDLSRTGIAMGTIDYMAPEQWRNSSGVDIRADLYALGCTLFYLLTGKPPYGHDEFDTDRDKLMAHTKAPIPSIREHRDDCPEEVDQLVERLLAKDPADRFESPSELAQAAERFADTQSAMRIAGVVDGLTMEIAARTDSYKRRMGTEDGGFDSRRPDKGGSTVASGTTIVLPISPRMLLILLGVATIVASIVIALFWRPPKPHERRGELVAMPGLNGGWWFDETPWFAPGLRAVLGKAIDGGERMIGDESITAALNQSRTSDVEVLHEDLQAVADQLRSRLPPREYELVSQLWKIDPEGQDETSFLEELGGIAKQMKAVDDLTPTEAHLYAVIQHRRGKDHWEDAERAYVDALAGYEAAEQYDLYALCAVDLARLLAAQRDRMLLAFDWLTKAREHTSAPALHFDTFCQQADFERDRGKIDAALAAFDEADKITEIPEDHPLRAYSQEHRGWSYLEAWRLDEAKKSFSNAYALREGQRTGTDGRRFNLRAPYYLLWIRQGQAMTEYFLGNTDEAKNKFSALSTSIDKALEDGEDDSLTYKYKLSSKQKSEYKKRRPNIYERWADCFITGTLSAEATQRQKDYAEAEELLGHWYAEALELGFERDQRADHVTRVMYKRAITKLLSSGVDAAIAQFETARDHEAKSDLSEKAQAIVKLEKRVAGEMIHLAANEQQRETLDPLVGDIGSLADLLLNDEMTAAGEVSRRNIDMILLAYEALVNSRQLDDDPTALQRVVIQLLAITEKPRANSKGAVNPYLQRFFDAVRNAVNRSLKNRESSDLRAALKKLDAALP
jgi:serine/threonine protein kinase